MGENKQPIIRLLLPMINLTICIMTTAIIIILSLITKCSRPNSTNVDTGFCHCSNWKSTIHFRVYNVLCLIRKLSWTSRPLRQAISSNCPDDKAKWPWGQRKLADQAHYRLWKVGPIVLIQNIVLFIFPDSRRSDYDGERFDPELRDDGRTSPGTGSGRSLASHGVPLQTPRRHCGSVQRSRGTTEEFPQTHASIPAAPATRLRHLHSWPGKESSFMWCSDLARLSSKQHVICAV